MPKIGYELSHFKKKFAIDKIGHICSDEEPIAKPLHVIIDHLLSNDALNEGGTVLKRIFFIYFLKSNNKNSDLFFVNLIKIRFFAVFLQIFLFFSIYLV